MSAMLRIRCKLVHVHSIMHATTLCLLTNLGLPLGLEAPVMTPDTVIFSFFSFLVSSRCHLLMLCRTRGPIDRPQYMKQHSPEQGGVLIMMAGILRLMSDATNWASHIEKLGGP